MFKRKTKEPSQIGCPYCSKAFFPEELLFCDTDGDHVMEDPQYDPAYASFISGMIPYNRAALKKGGHIEMAKRPKYFFHPWSGKYREGKPFTKPMDIHMGGGHGLYPEVITVYRKNGLTPAMEASSKADAGDAAAKALKEARQPGSIFDRESAPVTDDGPSFSESATIRLTTKACPRCHCILPENVGLYPLHRVVMLGSTRAGKTTYMTLAAHQLASGTGMPGGLASDCIIGEESKRYFDYLINCLKANVVPATLLMKKDMIQVVFPIVVTVRPTGGHSPFFLVINDCPGEAMNDRTFLDNFAALRDAEGAILIMDPCQFTNELREEVSKTADLGPHVDLCDQQFMQTLQIIKQRLHEYAKLRQIVMTLTKLDLVYGLGPTHLIRPGMYPFMDEPDLRRQHEGAIDLEWITQLSAQVSDAISKKLKYEAYQHNLSSVLSYSRVDITTLCCSTRTWNASEKRFITPSDPSEELQNINMTGYRLLEPLLCILGRCGLLPARDA